MQTIFTGLCLLRKCLQIKPENGDQTSLPYLRHGWTLDTLHKTQTIPVIHSSYSKSFSRSRSPFASSHHHEFVLRDRYKTNVPSWRPSSQDKPIRSLELVVCSWQRRPNLQGHDFKLASTNRQTLLEELSSTPPFSLTFTTGVERWWQTRSAHDYNTWTRKRRADHQNYKGRRS